MELKRQFQISALAVVILVLLRIAIGWHFLHEGVWKFGEADFSAEPYLRQARGPFANGYRRLIPDFYGEERLSYEATKARWADLQQQAVGHFRFNPAQRKEAQNAVNLRLKEYEATLWEDKSEADAKAPSKKPRTERVAKEPVRWYQEGLAQWRADEARRETHAVPFERKRHFDHLTKLQQDIQPYLEEVNRLEKGLRADLTRVATQEQRTAAGDLPERKTWLDLLETLTTYSLIALGVCLMIGLATRLAAVGGAIFLLTAVVLPQLSWPSTYPPPPPSAGHSFLVNKEVIEMLVLLLITATPAGRWAGLDYIGHGLFTRYYGAVEGFIERHLRTLISAAVSIVSRLLGRGPKSEKADERPDTEKDKEKSDAPAS
jgi:uncharacterized membrane protein YphA (DoxX/SURF4 family)